MQMIKHQTQNQQVVTSEETGEQRSSQKKVQYIGRKESFLNKFLRKSSITDGLLYSNKNYKTVKEELTLPDDLFKLLCAVHEDMCHQSQE